MFAVAQNTDLRSRLVNKIRNPKYISSSLDLARIGQDSEMPIKIRRTYGREFYRGNRVFQLDDSKLPVGK